MLISVIIPVYNSEKFLNRCVDSVLKQSYKELDIILIDDGSSDKSGEMCDQYAQMDKRVRVIHQKNRGVSAARNSGLDVAIGDYCTFVDSDDYIESEMYQSMIDIAEQYNCDVIMCDCVKEFGTRTEAYTHDIRQGYYDREQLEKEYFPHLLIMPNIRQQFQTGFAFTDETRSRNRNLKKEIIICIMRKGSAFQRICCLAQNFFTMQIHFII